MTTRRVVYARFLSRTTEKSCTFLRWIPTAPLAEPIPRSHSGSPNYTLTVTGTQIDTVHMELDAPDCYELYINGAKISTIDEGGLGCNGWSGTWTVLLKMPSSEGSGSGGEGGVSGGSSGGGGGSNGSGAVTGSFSMGGSMNQSAGAISFSSGTISTDLFSPGALNYVSVTPDVEVLRDSSTQFLRQIKAPEVLADVVTLSPTSYEIRFYPISQVGAKVSGLYALRTCL